MMDTNNSEGAITRMVAAASGMPCKLEINPAPRNITREVETPMTSSILKATWKI